jgi:hypothetical protein
LLNIFWSSYIKLMFILNFEQKHFQF